MSALAFWLLMLLIALFVAALVAVGLSVRLLLRRSQQMATELDGLSNDISAVVSSARVADPASEG
jgi:hypothetical protein